MWQQGSVPCSRECLSPSRCLALVRPAESPCCGCMSTLMQNQQCLWKSVISGECHHAEVAMSWVQPEAVRTGPVWGPQGSLLATRQDRGQEHLLPSPRSSSSSPGASPGCPPPFCTWWSCLRRRVQELQPTEGPAAHSQPHASSACGREVCGCPGLPTWQKQKPAGVKTRPSRTCHDESDPPEVHPGTAPAPRVLPPICKHRCHKHDACSGIHRGRRVVDTRSLILQPWFGAPWSPPAAG